MASDEHEDFSIFALRVLQMWLPREYDSPPVDVLVARYYLLVNDWYADRFGNYFLRLWAALLIVMIKEV